MTAAISFRSLGTTASRSTIDAIFSTSYGVRFFERAYERSTFDHSTWNACSCAWTSCRDVVFFRKSYSAGNRNPSSGSFAAPKPLTCCGPDAFKYVRAEIFGCT